MSVTTATRSAGETLALGEAIGRLLRAGDVVVLVGELGTGKTVLTKGIARGLGVTDPVVSPTFTIVREYRGRLPLVHVDVYRLDHLQELHDLGFDDLLGGPAVAVIEWGDRVGSLLPVDRLDIRLELANVDSADDDRTVTLEAFGRCWTARREALELLASPADGADT